MYPLAPGLAIRDYVHDVLREQDLFLSGSSHLNEDEVMDKICEWANEKFSFLTYECREAIRSTENEIYTRTAWKYAAEN